MPNLIAISLTWYLISLSGVLAPGPLSAMSVGEGARRGFWAGPLLALGHALTELAMVTALVLGLREFLQQPLIAGVIGLVGGAVLLWMGYDLAVSGWRGDALARGSAKPLVGERGERASASGVILQPGGTETGLARLGHLPAGVLLSVGNPYWFIWWATVGASYLLMFMHYGPVGLALFYLGHVSLDLGWMSLLSFLSASGRGAIPDAVYQGVLVVCGLFLIAMSLYFGASGVGFLLGQL